MIPEKLVELSPKEWTSRTTSARPKPPRYTLKVICLALAVSALYNFRSVVHAVSSLSAPAADHSQVPPGNYVWTPDHGLQPAPHR